MKTTGISRIISLILVFAMLSAMLVFNTSAKNTGDDLFTYVIEGDTVTILKCSETASGDVLIPEEIDGKKVTKIDKAAFKGCKYITDLVIPEGVTVIGYETEAATFTTDDYMDLFVKEGLLYHINFADATAEDKVDKAVDANAKYADSRFSASAESYNPFVVYTADGINGPWSGGSTEVNEGGWYFLSPYRYSYWYQEYTAEGGETKYKFSGRSTSVASADYFVTLAPGEAASNLPAKVLKLDANGNELAGYDEDTQEEIPENYENVTYYYYKGAPKKAQPNYKVGSSNRDLYTLEHKAPDDATGYYIADGVWGGARYPSSFGDGYFDAKNGNEIKFYQGGTFDAVKTAKALTIELTVASKSLKKAAFFLGPRFEYTPEATLVKFTGTEDADMIKTLYKPATNTTEEVPGYKTIIMGDSENPFDGRKINTFTFTLDMADIANYNYVLKAYGNGKLYSTQSLVSTKAEFTALDQYVMRGDGVQNYAMRVYNSVLTDKQVLQNHFADVATIAKLDITEFLKLTEAEKQSVYLAFEGAQADDDRAVLQLKLDMAISFETETEKATYYDLFVKEGLIYHLNFAEAKADTKILSDNPDAAYAHQKFLASPKTYLPYLVGGNSYFVNEDGTPTGKYPWSGGTTDISALTGGWDFITPYRYDYWFDESKDLAIKTKSTSPSLNSMVTAADNMFDFIEAGTGTAGTGVGDDGRLNKVAAKIGYAWERGCLIKIA